MDKRQGEKRKPNYINVCAIQWFMRQYINTHDKSKDLI